MFCLIILQPDFFQTFFQKSEHSIFDWVAIDCKIVLTFEKRWTFWLSFFFWEIYFSMNTLYFLVQAKTLKEK